VQEVRVDPSRRILILEIGHPLRAGEADALRLSVEAGVSLLDHGPFGAMIVTRGSPPAGRPYDLVRSLTEESARLGARKIARVSGSPPPPSPENPGAYQISDFPDESGAARWLAEDARPGPPRQRNRKRA